MNEYYDSSPITLPVMYQCVFPITLALSVFQESVVVVCGEQCADEMLLLRLTSALSQC